MTDHDQALDAIGRAADELLPRLTERLERHALGEIEVEHGELRLRVTRSAAASARPPQPSDAVAGRPERPPGTETPPAPAASGGHGISSPAVGFFVYADGLGPGLSVEKGDAIGHVEMLGVRHDVRAPRRGVVRSLVAESGEAVEYGQVVAELDAVEVGR